MSRTAFVCWRPFQLFNIVNMVMNGIESDKENIDLYIQNSPYLTVFKNGIEKSKLFSKIFWFNDYDYESFWNHFLYRINTLFPTHELKSQLSFSDYLEAISINYTTICSSGWNHFFIALANINKSAEKIMFDDGTGTYMACNRWMSVSGNFHKFENYIYKLLKKGSLNINFSKVYVNALDMYDYNDNKDQISVKQLPNITEDVYKKEKEVFSYKKLEIYNNKKLIFLTSYKKPEDEPGWQLKKDYSTDKLMDFILNYREYMIIRPHPADITDYSGMGITEDRSKAMWELLCYDVINDNSILLGFFSSAQLMPYFIYKQSPYIIFLNKIIWDDNYEKNIEFNMLIEKLIKKYPGKIYQPESLNELKILLDKLLF